MAKITQKKHIFKDNTYFIKPKDDWKDRIEVEVGDSKQPDFKDQIKIIRWDNEVNCSIRLKDDELSTISEKDGKIIVSKQKKELNFYDVENGYEFEVILKEKPKTNTIEFTLQDKGVEYFYQPELTQEEKDKGASRPENVVGSYAVYASQNKVNYVGGKEYKCGKVGHIFRPKIIDSAGTEVWGELHIENGILSVTIPQDFLDNAVYPVRHAAGLTFGYETQGDSIRGLDDWITGSLFTGAAGTGVSITFSAQRVASTDGSKKTKCAIYIHSTLALLTNGLTEEATIAYNSTKTLQTINFASAPTLTAVDYVLTVRSEGFAGIPAVNFDTGASNQGHHLYLEYTTAYPNPITFSSHSFDKTSIYVTYTAGGTTTGPFPTFLPA
jgi:hypothetical protein